MKTLASSFSLHSLTSAFMGIAITLAISSLNFQGQRPSLCHPFPCQCLESRHFWNLSVYSLPHLFSFDSVSHMPLLLRFPPSHLTSPPCPHHVTKYQDQVIFLLILGSQILFYNLTLIKISIWQLAARGWSLVRKLGEELGLKKDMQLSTPLNFEAGRQGGRAIISWRT